MAESKINVEIKAELKPPLGLRPRKIVEMMRFQEVCEAIVRYYTADMPIPIEWVEEYNDLVTRVHQHV